MLMIMITISNIFSLFLQLLAGSGQSTTASAQSPVPAGNSGAGGSGVVVGNANNG